MAGSHAAHIALLILAAALTGVLLLQTVDYRIFEYAHSEDQVTGVILLVAVCIDQNLAHRVTGYLEPDWQRAINKTSAFDLGYVEDFIYDLRQLSFKPAHDVTQFFHQTEALCIGPLRTHTAGMCEFVDLSASATSLLQQSHGISICSYTSFSELVSELVNLCEVTSRS